MTVVAALAVFAVAGAPAASAATEKDLPGSAPTWVSKAHSLGKVKASTPVAFRIYLTPNGGVDAVKAAVAKVSNPESASYRQFLSASEYHTRYDAPATQVMKVTAWLSKNHITVTEVEAHHRYLSVSTTAGAVQSVFKATINRYQRQGKVVQANSKTLKLPAAIAPLVQTVSGLDTTERRVQPRKAPPSPGFANARPCSASYGQLAASRQADYKTPLPKFKGKVLPYAVCGYTGTQLRSAYENNSTLDGSGVTVAITDAYASPTIAYDAKTYAANHGDAAYKRGQLVGVPANPYRFETDCDASGWYGEETLDVEAVHAMAPGANIRYYASMSCANADFLTTLFKVVDDNKAQIVSNSWGSFGADTPADEIYANESVFLQGALQGITFMFSSGDSGDDQAATGLKQTDYPTSDPYVTAVGGTSDAIGADKKFKFQTGWGTHKYTLGDSQRTWGSGVFQYGAGGGSSSLVNRPDYQQGVVSSKFGPGRGVPDVGLTADPNTGMLIGQTQTLPDGVYYGEYRIGGTSLASPLFAGMTALLVQHVGGGRGFLNPTIYHQAGSRTFTDISGTPADAGNVRVDYANGIDGSGGVLYSVRTFNQDSSLKTGPGWDQVTGVGSPNAYWITSVSGN